MVLDSTEDGAHYRSWAHWDLVTPQLYVHTGGYSRVSDEFARRVKDKTGARGGCGTLVAIGRALETPALATRLATLPAPTPTQAAVLPEAMASSSSSNEGERDAKRPRPPQQQQGMWHFLNRESAAALAKASRDV